MQLKDLSFYWLIGYSYPECPEGFQWSFAKKVDYTFEQVYNFYVKLAESGEIQAFIVTDGTGLTDHLWHADIVREVLEFEVKL